MNELFGFTKSNKKQGRKGNVDKSKNERKSKTRKNKSKKKIREKKGK